MNATQLCKSLAPRLQKAVPSGFNVTCNNKDDLVFFADGYPGRSGAYVAQFFGALPGDPADLLVEACTYILSALQDYVAELSTDPWPGKRSMPVPGCRLASDKIYLWYGEEGMPLLVIDPIPLTE